jgi:glycyl-tRNA synthetase alpha subunit
MYLKVFTDSGTLFITVFTVIVGFGLMYVVSKVETLKKQRDQESLEELNNVNDSGDFFQTSEEKQTEYLLASFEQSEDFQNFKKKRMEEEKKIEARLRRKVPIYHSFVKPGESLSA